MQNLPVTRLKESIFLPTLKHLKASRAYWQKPQSWPDIRQSAAPSAAGTYGINLLVCNAYPNFGFKVTCAGGYSVYVNGVKQGDYASAAQCSLTLAGLSGGYAISYPSTLSAHRVEVRPTANGNSITQFCLQRVAASGSENQGILWAHFNLTNQIDLYRCFIAYSDNIYSAPLLEAVTAKNGVLSAINLNTCLTSSYTMLKTFPNISAAGIIGTRLATFTSAQLRTVVIREITNALTSMSQVFYANANLRKIWFTDCVFSSVVSYAECHRDNRSLIALPKYNYAAATDMTNFITNAVSLEDTYLDVSAAASLSKIGCYGTAQYPIAGLKGLKVSSSAPFGGSAPQINISYSGLKRAALQSLFASLPTVSAGQVVQITGAAGASALTPQDISAATAKGWTVTL